MNTYEELEQEAYDEGIEIDKVPFNGRIDGLYVDGNIAINENLETTAERACVLVEELGHHHTTVGNIIDLSDSQNAKQERQARLWAYNRKIGLKGIISAYEHGCQNRYEIAEHLNVTDEFLQDAVECYRDKYGTLTMIDNYIIYFIPNLMIGQMI